VTTADPCQPGARRRAGRAAGRGRGPAHLAAAAVALLAAGTVTGAGAGPAPAAAGPAPAPAAAGPHHRGSTPGYCRTGGAALWRDLAACGWPGPATTGPDLARCPGHRLAPLGRGPGRRILVSRRGTVISCRHITGLLDVRARGTVIEDSVIVSNSGRTGERANGTAGITVTPGASATVEHVAINGDHGVHACIWHEGTRLTVNAVNCYGVDDGIFSWPAGPPGSGGGFTIRNSYFHGFTHATANGHEDGYQTEGASDGLIEHNTYRMSPGANSAVAIWDSRASSRHITVRDNLITGLRRHRLPLAMATRRSQGSLARAYWVNSSSRALTAGRALIVPHPVNAHGRVWLPPAVKFAGPVVSPRNCCWPSRRRARAGCGPPGWRARPWHRCSCGSTRRWSAPGRPGWRPSRTAPRRR
jgi:hypothetical protein